MGKFVQKDFKVLVGGKRINMYVSIVDEDGIVHISSLPIGMEDFAKVVATMFQKESGFENEFAEYSGREDFELTGVCFTYHGVEMKVERENAEAQRIVQMWQKKQEDVAQFEG